MGSILITVPDIEDSYLIYDEHETKQILKFFWPHMTKGIDEMSIDNEARRLAQTALIAAVDGSYAMGFIQSTFRAVTRPGSGIKPLVGKLARAYIKHWFKHATQDDLKDVRIYESIRSRISTNLGTHLHQKIQGASLSRMSPFFANAETSNTVWV